MTVIVKFGPVVLTAELTVEQATALDELLRMCSYVPGMKVDGLAVADLLSAALGKEISRVGLERTEVDPCWPAKIHDG